MDSNNHSEATSSKSKNKINETQQTSNNKK